MARFMLWMVMIAVAGTAGRGFGADEIPEKVSQAFAKADRNQDRKLTVEEFLIDRGPADVAKRDFKLFDHNGDGTLDLNEFWSIPAPPSAEIRGPMPDPMQIVVDQVMTALDKSLEVWIENPKTEVDAGAFLMAFSQRFQKYGVRPGQHELDPDKDGKVTRDEARRFLEIQFGIRRGDGKLLRLPTGRVVNYMLYLHVDLNRNDHLERSEFMERSYGDPKHVGKEFDDANLDRDLSLSFDEWCLVPGRSINDPVVEFQQMDKNQDAFVDREELLAGSPDWKGMLTTKVFPAFDLNKDGKLSLTEYRLTMPANMVMPWQTVLTDADGDEALSFNEFKFDPTPFPMLRMLYFHRLDLNSNGMLEQNEATFTVKVADEFFTMNADGTGWKSLYRFAGHSACGSPTVSPDGKQIAFDSWSKNQQSGSAIFVMSIDGGEPREIASGMMPSWSSTGKTLACSRSSPVFGVWLLPLDDDDPEHITAGWGAQLSPDGMKVAYTEGRALKIYDLENKTLDVILDGDANPYQQIFWNAAWSPDGKRLCFKGSKGDGTQEVATVNTTGKPDLKIHHTGKVAVNADFAWHPREDRIIFSMFCAERAHTQMYEFNPNKTDAPVLVKGQDVGRNNTDMCWTPDGKRLIIVSGDF